MPSRKWDTVWVGVQDERRALRADLAGLPPDAWSEPSLCPGWDVHDVVAHLIDTAKTTRWGFVRRMIAVRFDFDRDNEVGIERERREHPSATLAEFDRIIGARDTPPAPSATRLMEAVVHGEDIRRPLGIRRDYPVARVLPALRYQISTKAAMGGGRERAAGFRLEASDADFSSGTGPEVRGTALALLLATSGRPVEAGELFGSGAAAFGRR